MSAPEPPSPEEMADVAREAHVTRALANLRAGDTIEGTIRLALREGERIERRRAGAREAELAAEVERLRAETNAVRNALTSTGLGDGSAVDLADEAALFRLLFPYCNRLVDGGECVLERGHSGFCTRWSGP